MKDPYEQLKRLERADLRRQEREARAQAKALRKTERRERHRELWPRWVAFWERRATELGVAAKVVGFVSAILGGLAGAKKAWGLLHARDVGRAELPASGVASTGEDFVTKHPPDGGATNK